MSCPVNLAKLCNARADLQSKSRQWGRLLAGDQQERKGPGQGGFKLTWHRLQWRQLQLSPALVLRLSLEITLGGARTNPGHDTQKTPRSAPNITSTCPVVLQVFVTLGRWSCSPSQESNLFAKHEFGPSGCQGHWSREARNVAFATCLVSGGRGRWLA